jgi:hypothetical protein
MAQDAGGKGQMAAPDPERLRDGVVVGFAQELVLYTIEPCPDLIIVL